MSVESAVKLKTLIAFLPHPLGIRVLCCSGVGSVRSPNLTGTCPQQSQQVNKECLVQTLGYEVFTLSSA